jgi:hypothetical protein
MVRGLIIIPHCPRILSGFNIAFPRKPDHFLTNLLAVTAKRTILAVIKKTVNYASLQRIRISKLKGIVQSSHEGRVCDSGIQFQQS